MSSSSRKRRRELANVGKGWAELVGREGEGAGVQLRDENPSSPSQEPEAGILACQGERPSCYRQFVVDVGDISLRDSAARMGRTATGRAEGASRARQCNDATINEGDISVA